MGPRRSAQRDGRSESTARRTRRWRSQSEATSPPDRPPGARNAPVASVPSNRCLSHAASDLGRASGIGAKVTPPSREFVPTSKENETDDSESLGARLFAAHPRDAAPVETNNVNRSTYELRCFVGSQFDQSPRRFAGVGPLEKRGICRQVLQRSACAATNDQPTTRWVIECLNPNLLVTTLHKP